MKKPDEERAEEILEAICRTNRKSHTALDVVLALLEGLPVFDVDTGASGNDDVIIAPDGEGEEWVRDLFVEHFELDEWPEDWKIWRLDPGGLLPKNDLEPPEGACPNGIWASGPLGWLHDATCGCEARTGLDPYTGREIEE